jgi:penicillin-binding protein 1C
MKRIALLLIACCPLWAGAAATFDQVRQAHRPSDVLLLDRHGETLHRLRTDTQARRGPWTPLADMSPALRHAMLLSEDRRFWEHSGVDWQAVSSAAWGNLWNTRTRGASTVTMQLAGLLDEELRAGRGGRDLGQKLGQAWAAQRLERHWRKDQILEAYLNLVPFRGELVGVDALSRTLFGKAPHGLDAAEAAIAAALVRSPNAAAPAVAARACGILRAMQPGPARGGCDALDLLAAAALQRRAFDASAGSAPHLARRLAVAGGPPVLRTSVRADVQRLAVQALQQQLRELHGRHVEDGAVIVLDNATGEVLAWVGSSGVLSDAAEVDGVTAARQPGSTLKPFLYAQAIGERRITAASLLDDSPAAIPTAAGLYIPQNYDRRHRGWVSVRSALGASLNLPAVRTLAMVSPDAFARQLQRLGVRLRETGDFYGDSLALGSAEASLLELANAYRCLANQGRCSPVRFTPAPAGAATAAGTQALPAAAAWIVGDILADGNARALTFGTDSVLATRFWTAVKTGTSKDMRDNWAFGWSQRYTVGVWVGNASGAPMHDVSGTSGAAPVWATLMQHLHRGQASRAPAPPAGLVAADVRFAPGGEPARREWFLEGTAQVQFATAPAPAAAGQAPRILAPVDGTILALDPDIPPERQRVLLRAQGAGLRWQLDGKPLGRGNELPWLPWPGRHQLQLADAGGRVLDSVRVEVRGAGVRGQASRR